MRGSHACITGKQKGICAKTVIVRYIYFNSIQIKAFLHTNLPVYHPQGEFYFCSTKGQKCHSEVEYPRDKDVYLVFGKESHGLPEPLLKENYERCIRIPMLGFVRSLNLSNAVAICAYEVLRQLGYPNLSDEGRLTGRED